MSPVRRIRSASVESIPSRRFFSRITCWDLCGFDHRFGSAACLSISASCGRSLPASKVLPEFADLLLQSCIFLLEFLNHSVGLPFAGVKEATIAPIEIIAHAYASQSPCRL